MSIKPAVACWIASALAAWAPAAFAVVPGERTGKQVVETFCFECHGTGANGAPKIGDVKAWKPRAARGLTSLTDSALAGVRKMPPHGGTLQINDLELKRAITYMVNLSGGRWNEPIDRKAKLAARGGMADLTDAEMRAAVISMFQTSAKEKETKR